MTINFDHLEKLISIAERSNIESLEVVDGGQRISIICQPKKTLPQNIVPMSEPITKSHVDSDSNTPSPSSKILSPSSKTFVPHKNNDVNSNANNNDQTTESDQGDFILAPMLGTFYRRSNPESDEFVQIGDNIEVGTTLCVVEAMKIMHEVKATRAGKIQNVLVEDGEIVEYEQPLFVISTV